LKAFDIKVLRRMLRYKMGELLSEWET